MADDESVDPYAGLIDFERFFDLAVDVLVVTRPDGYFQMINKAFADMLGVDREVVLANPWSEFVHPDDRELSIDENEREFDPGYRTMTFENRYIDAKGGVHWLDWNAELDPSTGLVYGMARDVTQHRQARDALQSAYKVAQEARAAAEAASDEPDARGVDVGALRHPVEDLERVGEERGLRGDALAIAVAPVVDQQEGARPEAIRRARPFGRLLGVAPVGDQQRRGRPRRLHEHARQHRCIAGRHAHGLHGPVLRRRGPPRDGHGMEEQLVLQQPEQRREAAVARDDDERSGLEQRYRGRLVVPMRKMSTSRAAWRPSRIAHTTSDWPRRMSPAANTFGTEVA